MAIKEVQLTVSVERSLKAIRSILEKRGWTIRTFKPEEGVIGARTPASILSWGEDITIRAKSNPKGSVVGIESSPFAQIFDWGRSQSNVEDLASEISALRVAE